MNWVTERMMRFGLMSLMPCAPSAPTAPQTPTSLLQDLGKMVQQQSCVGSVPTASKLLRFGMAPVTEAYKKDTDSSFFI